MNTAVPAIDNITKPSPAPVPAKAQAPAVAPADNLADLANQIKKCVADIKDAERGMEKTRLMRAYHAGGLLNKAKATLVDHGEWLQWLEDHCDLSERTAQRYMRLADYREMIEHEAKSANMADLTMSKAEWLIKKHAPDDDDETEDTTKADKPKKRLAGNAPATAEDARALATEFVNALRSLRRNNESEAQAIANHLVESLQEVDLL
jgi:hypothetical protein